VFPDVTVFWVIFLILLTGVILNGLILKPVLRVMADREGAVKSARELAESAAAQARAATAEFDARTQAARGEIYREMDEKRRRALGRRADLLAETRTRVEAEIVAARERLKQQAADARATLERDANVLAGDIVERVLGRKAS
jgi:F-type H+-transporting ATPase subunit b